MNNQQQKNKNQPSPSQPNAGNSSNFRWWYAVIALLALSYFFSATRQIPEVTWKDFRQNMLNEGDVDRVEIVNQQRAEIYIRKDSLGKGRYDGVAEKWFGEGPAAGPHFFLMIGSVEVFTQNLEEAEAKADLENTIEVSYTQRENWWGSILTWIIIFFLFYMFWSFLARRMSGAGRGGMGGALFNFGKSKAQEFEKDEKSDVTFDDIAGLEEAKQEIMEIVKFLKNPDKFKKIGAKMPKGVILAGPPGTGKTLLAKAVAGEAEVPFFSTSASEFIEMFVGVGASRIRDLFSKAKQKAPSIIFIDEIDSIGKSRGKSQYFQTNDEREGTLNQLLAELDGFDANTGVIVLAATNRPDTIDSALLRPGRFDRRINMELPSRTEREAIFEVHTRPVQTTDDLDIKSLAMQTPGFSGADIANVCNEAALIAVRDDKEKVEKEDFLKAIERVVGGLERKSKVISDEEKKVIAYHEAGHAVASWYLSQAHPLVKVSIIPRGRSLGGTWYSPQEKQIYTRQRFEDMICVALGGRAAEETIFDEISSNALDDLQRITKQAYGMVASYGFSQKIPHISYHASSEQMEQSFQKPYSEHTAKIIDEEVHQLIQAAYARTKDIIQEHQSELETLAQTLIDKEVVYREEIDKIFAQKPAYEEAEE